MNLKGKIGTEAQPSSYSSFTVVYSQRRWKPNSITPQKSEDAPSTRKKRSIGSKHARCVRFQRISEVLGRGRGAIAVEEKVRSMFLSISKAVARCFTPNFGSRVRSACVCRARALSSHPNIVYSTHSAYIHSPISLGYSS